MDAHFTGAFRKELEHFKQSRFIIDEQNREQGQNTFNY
jgi:hypothetical protein